MTRIGKVYHLASVLAFHVRPSPFVSNSRYAQHPVVDIAAMASSRSDQESSSSLSDNNHKASLISSYLVDMTTQNGAHAWSLTPIDEVVSENHEEEDVEINLSSGATSWKALHSTDRRQSTAPATLTSHLDGNTIDIKVVSSVEEENEKGLLFVLPRVLAQFTAAGQGGDDTEQRWNIVIHSETSKTEELKGVSLSGVEGIHALYSVDPAMEIVDMTDWKGGVLGMVPRNLVHSLNILHRGIGLTCSKDAAFSELYVHRRTDFKRIFPSLYDMFVGGVSLSGEDPKLTAAREVAEELGLSRALLLDENSNEEQPNHEALSDPLFTCVVCTSYNRCVVTVFQYTIQDPSAETISWQEEEVSWGEFVPYNLVEAAADLSIQRLVSKKEWPGTLPAIQSKWKGSKSPENDAYQNKDWTSWDFVPDGLLVWEAWLQWRASR